MFSKPKFHEGKKWERFFKLYDEAAKPPMFDESKLIPTKFGDTQVNVKGDSDNPPLVCLHGIADCSIMYGEWLFPKLSQVYYCIAIDTIGDLGRSCPKDRDPDKGIHNEEETAMWLVEVLDALCINKPINLVGHSFGSFLATCLARQRPDRVEKLVLTAPACVVAPISKYWLFQAITFGMVSAVVRRDGMVGKRMRKWFFGTMLVNYENMEKMEHKELHYAAENLGGPQVPMQPVDYDVESLTKMNEKCPTMLVIGHQECVIDPKVAIQRATQAKIRVVAYDNASHMFYLENPRDVAIDEIKAFLSG